MMSPYADDRITCARCGADKDFDRVLCPECYIEENNWQERMDACLACLSMTHWSTVRGIARKANLAKTTAWKALDLLVRVGRAHRTESGHFVLSPAVAAGVHEAGALQGDLAEVCTFASSGQGSDDSSPLFSSLSLSLKREGIRDTPKTAPDQRFLGRGFGTDR